MESPKIGTPEFDRMMAKAIEEDGEDVVFGALSKTIIDIGRRELAETPEKRKELSDKIRKFHKDVGILLFDTYEFSPVEAILALGHEFMQSIKMFFVFAAKAKEMKAKEGKP